MRSATRGHTLTMHDSYEYVHKHATNMTHDRICLLPRLTPSSALEPMAVVPNPLCVQASLSVCRLANIVGAAIQKTYLNNYNCFM